MKNALCLLLLILASCSCQQSQPTQQQGPPDLELVVNANVSKIADSDWDEMVKVLENRFLAFDSTQIAVQRLDAPNKLTIKLWGDCNLNNAQSLIEKPGHLIITETYESIELLNNLSQINQLLINQNNFNLYTVDSQFTQMPLYLKLTLPLTENNQIKPGPSMGTVHVKDTALVRQLFNFPSVRALLPQDLQTAWYPANDAPQYYQLIALRTMPVDRPPMNESMIETASAVLSPRGDAEVRIQLKEAYHQPWSQLTSKNIGRALALLIDGQVQAIPNVICQIDGGNLSISHFKTEQETQQMAALFTSGALPVMLKIVSKEEANK